MEDMAHLLCSLLDLMPSGCLAEVQKHRAFLFVFAFCLRQDWMAMNLLEKYLDLNVQDAVYPTIELACQCSSSGMIVKGLLERIALPNTTPWSGFGLMHIACLKASFSRATALEALLDYGLGDTLNRA